MSNFIGMVFGTLQSKGIDTSKMSTEEAINKFNELESDDKISKTENKDDTNNKTNIIKKQKRAQIPYRGRENALKQIQQDIGVDMKTAQQTYEAFDDYTTNMYKEIRDINNTKEWAVRDRELIENYIAKAPPFDGEIYRGIRFKAAEGYNYIQSLKKDAIIDMKGISSWSSDEKRAKSFAGKGAYSYQIVFKTKNENGVGIKHLSTHDQEDEVITSSKQLYKVNNVKKSGKYYIVDLEETE